MIRAARLLSASPSLQLNCGMHRVVVAPQAGGRVLSLASVLPDASLHHWLTPVTVPQWHDHAWPKGGCYPLVPFSNRVRGARFAFAGREYRLATYAGQTHALHGYGQYEAWQVLARSPTAVTLAYAHRGGALGWPWAFRATQTFSLDERGLSIAMTLQNQSDAVMPAGFGLHPYFSADCAVLAARWRWPHDHEEIAQRREPMAAGAHTFIRTPGGFTDYLSEWGGEALLQWRNGAMLALTAHAVFEHLVVHCAPQRAYLCLEPVTHVSDAFNLAHAGVPGTGLRHLAPGASLAGWMTLRLQPGAQPGCGESV